MILELLTHFCSSCYCNSYHTLVHSLTMNGNCGCGRMSQTRSTLREKGWRWSCPLKMVSRFWKLKLRITMEFVQWIFCQPLSMLTRSNAHITALSSGYGCSIRRDFECAEDTGYETSGPTVQTRKSCSTQTCPTASWLVISSYSGQMLIYHN